MIYPENFEEKVGFDKIRGILEESCISTMGRDRVHKISFCSSFDDLSLSLEQTNQFLQMMQFEPAFPAYDFIDMRDKLKLLTTEGKSIEQEDLHNLNTSLKAMEDVRVYLNKLDPEKYNELIRLTVDMDGWEEFTNHADEIIDPKGEIRPDASPFLLEISRKIKSHEKSLSSKIQQTLSQAKKSGWLAEEGEITVRNGRLVIPLKASQKRKVKGFIHDESSSGQTIYIEPESAFETNNEIRKLRNEYYQEIKRLLAEFTNWLRPYISELIEDYEWLGFIDFLRSKAILAIKINASKPKLFNEQRFNWQQAIHPLLYLVFKEQNKQVIPLDIELNKEQRMLIISGPNAGGKSVCLKTAGLLQYMLQCGLLVPMKASSECGIFNRIFIDIGDEQSLENDLSTYSSHLNNIRFFTQEVNNSTLIMIDEMGTGTEPQMGGAIAEASLEKLYEKGAYAVITTHYANLKLMADRYPAIVNGAMLFDTARIQPLFRLKIGKPGNSFAFEIAKNTGLPEEILNKARIKTGKTHLDFEEQLQSLEQDKSQISEKEHELKLADELLEETINKYNKLTAEIEEHRSEIMQKAKEEAKQILNNSNKLIEKTIREIKEAKANKSKTKEIRDKLNTEKEKVLLEQKNFRKNHHKSEKKQEKPLTQKQPEPIQGPLNPGDSVRIRGQESIGQIISVKKNKAEVSFGQMKMQVPLNKLEKIKAIPKDKKQKHSMYGNIMESMQKKYESFSATLDLRGARADEALNKLMHFIDEATLLGVYDLRILHGKGNGVLRNVVRDYLAGVDEVKNFKDEHVERGGQGITLVTLR
ncbi:MAG: Smr/MutS family protein [Bacteroidales bacterium]|nr:Smr/MutS family protein [Bacteroidales bacterium]